MTREWGRLALDDCGWIDFTGTSLRVAYMLAQACVVSLGTIRVLGAFTGGRGNACTSGAESSR